MPICKTCRGEYVREECLCPQCLQPPGRGENLCHRCGAEMRGKRLCPRCKSDVVAWEQESFSLIEFIRRWGVLGLLPSLAALAVWLLFWWRRGEPLHHPAVSLVAIALSQLLLIVLYITRYSWRVRWWAFQVYGAPYLSLTAIIVGTFVGSILLAVFSFILYQLWMPPVTFWQQLFFGMVYAPIYVCLTASLTLLAILDYVDRLDQRVPPPIFVHTERLLRVAVEGAIQSQSVLEDRSASRTLARDFEVLEISRVPSDGSISALLRVSRQVSRPEDDSDARARWGEKLWRIEADRWGRVRSVKPAMSPAEQRASHQEWA